MAASAATFQSLTDALEQLQHDCVPLDLFPQPFEGLGGPPLALEDVDLRSQSLQRRLDEAFGNLQTLLRSCLPLVPPSGNSQERKVHETWDLCVTALGSLRTYLEGLVVEGRIRPVLDSKTDLSYIKQLWSKATGLAQHLRSRRFVTVAPSARVAVNVNWDGFYTSHSGWVRQLGFPGGAAGPLSSVRTAPASPDVQPSDLVWPAEGVTLNNLPACLALVTQWLSFARASLAASVRACSSDARASRVSLLRSGSISKWAKRMRPFARFQPYFPASVVDNSGSHRPPTCVSDHLLGACQEWSRVLQEPSVAWSHPLVSLWNDSLGYSRGAFAWSTFASAAVLDRHTLSAADLLGTFAAARRRLSMKYCTWDECVALYQWIVRGVAGYAPLVGIPSPVSLHEEDAAFQRLLLSGLGVRSTAERVSLLAASQSGCELCKLLWNPYPQWLGAFQASLEYLSCMVVSFSSFSGPPFPAWL